MKMPVAMKVVLLSLYLLFKIYLRLLKITTGAREILMQKEFAIQLKILCKIAHVQYTFLAVTFFMIPSNSFGIFLKFPDFQFKILSVKSLGNS